MTGRATRGMLANRLAAGGGVVIGALVLVALVGPPLAPFGPEQCSLETELLSPSRTHWLGTDPDGCDIFSRLLYGARLSVLVGISVVFTSVTIGTAVGLLAGLRGGRVDAALMFVLELFQAFPGFLIALAIVATATRPSVGLVIGALCISGWVGYARLVRGQAMVLRGADYVVAARALGFGEVRIALTQVLPNLLGPLVVQATFGLAGAILAEAGLSFLGLGVPPGTPSWGAMLHQGRSYLLVAPWLSVYPGIAIAATVFGFNLLGDALSDGLDPRRRSGGSAAR